ncbi:sigma-54 interaction domain-containing protein [Desulforhopalus singaporensis]|uniref:PAS domain S-box-containing protein n=1 Tax=Desulforhopalus singaporensis TaxID=91360 RepID=A0A1H0UEW0_9BACT|nr:sigma 54-interacting transcriptional regulator [Desulforhopalus singaporensis]SDP64663.1 PAS domain S-box-containing protein [Desulforhopalus singaporensis]
MAISRIPVKKSASTEVILESISDGVFTVDSDWQVTSFNRAAEEITGIPREEAIGRSCSEVLRSNMCGEDCPLAQTVKDGRPIIGRAGVFINASGNRIPISISTAVLRDERNRIIGGAETFRDLSEVEALRRELAGKTHLGTMTSQNAEMQRLFQIMPAIAASPSTVLVLGETGTGKELVARTIHNLSLHSRGPFIAVNCGALPDSLLESELFGYKAGAFTGANRDKPGRFALARGGTIFLDEIGEITPALQVKLLRVLQEKSFEPLGAVRTETTTARVIVATNQDLAKLLKQGLFREDLYYRINVIRLELPPLRRRKEDIPMLTESIIDRFNRCQQKNVSGVSTETLALLMAYDWPGNIRELENTIEHAFILCRTGTINNSHLPPEMLKPTLAAGRTTDLRTIRSVIDTQAIEAALARNGFNRLAAARELGIHKTTLLRRMKQLGVPFPERDGRSRDTQQ